MIGASAAISGTMAAAMRFAFQRGGPLGLSRRRRRQPIACRQFRCAASCAIARVLLFLVVWFGIKSCSGWARFPMTGSDQPVAWQAHIGGFLAGLLLFSWFDPTPDLPQIEDPAAMPH